MRRLCPSKCCKPPADKDDGEWTEPIKRKKSKRRVASHASSANTNVGRTKIIRPGIERQSNGRIRRGSLMEALDEVDERDDAEASGSQPLHDPVREESVGSSSSPTSGHISSGKGSDVVVDCKGSNDNLKYSVGQSCIAANAHIEGDDIENRNLSNVDSLANKMGEAKDDTGWGLRRMTHAFGFSPAGGTPTNNVHGKSPGRHTFSGAFKKMFAREEADAQKKGAHAAITSIASLGNGHFLTASTDDSIITMWKVTDVNSIGFEDESKSLGMFNSDLIELVRCFEGHSSGVTDLVKLDQKGRFLSAGKDMTIRLWDSRYDCDDDEEEVEQPLTLLATFANPDKRRVHTIRILERGSYVRPTDSIDLAMITAMAKKTALEGTHSVQEAAYKREIIECSGTFATASKNGKSVNIWDMEVLDRSKDPKCTNVAKITLLDSLEHDAHVEAMDAVEGKDMIVTGDALGDVFLWQNKRVGLVSKKHWTRVCKFTWRIKGKVFTPDEVFQQSITALCLLEGETKFVSCTKKGSIYIWDINLKSNQEVVDKNDAIRVKAKGCPLLAIQSLPSIEDPNTKERCLAFSLGYEDGSVVSCVIRNIDNKSKHGELGASIFHEAHYRNTRDNFCNDTEYNSVSSLALLEISKSSSAFEKSVASVVLVGGSSAGVHFLSPTPSKGLHQ